MISDDFLTFMKSYLSKLGVLLFGAMFAVAACQDYDEDIRKVNDKLDGATAELTEITEELDAAIADLEAKHDADLKKVNEDLQKASAAAEAAITALDAAYKSADAALKNELMGEDAKLQQQIKAAVDQATAALTALETAYKAADDELAKAYKAADDAVKTEVLAYVDGKVAALQKSVDALAAADKALEEAYKAADAKVLADAKADAAAELLKVKTALEATDKALETSINEHAKRLDDAEQEIIDLQEELEAAKKELEDAIKAAVEAEAEAREEADAALQESLEAAVAALTKAHEQDIMDVKALIAANAADIKKEAGLREAADKDLKAAYEAADAAEKKAREEADAALDQAIKDEAAARAEALKALEDKLSEMINANAAAIVELKKVDEQLKKDIEDVDKKVQTLRKELEMFYATKEDLTTEKIRLNELYTQVANIKEDVYKQLEGLKIKISDLNTRLSGLEVDVEALMGRVKSIVFAPDYTRNVAFVEYAKVLASPVVSEDGSVTYGKDMVLPKLSLIRYKVDAANAAEVAKDIALAWTAKEDILSYTLESVATTRAAVENDEELVVRNVEAEGEYLYVWVTAENFNECFYTGRPTNNEAVNSYAASLRFSDGNNDYATAYVVLAPIDEPMEIEVSIKHVEFGDTVYESSAVVDTTLAVNDVETILPVLEGYEAVLTSGGDALTEDELAMFPSIEIAFEEERTYTHNANEEACISDDSFTFTGEEMTETVQLAEALNKDYVGEVLHVTRTYTFGPSVATATYNVELTAEKRETTIVPDTTAVDWTLQRALDLRGDDKTPYSKSITIPAKYEFSYNLNDVFKSSDLVTPLVTEVTCNGKATSAWVGLTNYEGTAPNFTVNCNLHNYEFPAPGEKPNVYRVVWKATLGDYLYVVADLEITLNPRPSTVEITREVLLQLVPGTSYFQGPDALVKAAYDSLTPAYAGFNTANLAKPNAVLLAALNDGDNNVTNTPNYQTNLNFVVGEGDVDNSFVLLYNEQIDGNVPAASYEFKREIKPTWFGVPFIFNVTAKPQLPDYGLIASEDYMKTDEDGIAYVEVFGKINSEGIYTIDLADLGKYLGVTVGDGDDKTRELEHNLDVEFEIVKGDVKLADNEVAVIPEVEGPVAEKSGILRFGQLTADEAVVDWDQYDGTVVDVKATLKTSATEGAYVLDTKDFQLRTADPLSFEFGDTIRVTRVPGMSASAKVYENVVLKSSVEPSVENLVDQKATSIMEIFAKSHADKTYGIDTEVRIWGVYVDEAMTVPYSSQKWSKDETNGTVTLNADDGQLLYNIYAKATLEFKHNIHGVCTASKDIVIVFEPSADAKVMMNKFTNGGEIKLDDNLLLTQPLVIDNPNAVVTLDLGGKTIQNISKERDSEQYALRVKQGTLIIKGEGTVDGGSGCLYNIALRVDGPAVAYIEGGHFKVGADQDGDQNHCIYAADGGKVFISGGKFQSAPKKGTVPAEYTTLNLKDNTGASIEVKGGEFVNFNPGSITFEPGVTSFVKAGYKSVLKQYSTTDYIVVAE